MAARRAPATRLRTPSGVPNLPRWTRSAAKPSAPPRRFSSGPSPSSSPRRECCAPPALRADDERAAGRGGRRRRPPPSRPTFRPALRHRRRAGPRQPQDRQVDHHRRGGGPRPRARGGGRRLRPARRGAALPPARAGILPGRAAVGPARRRRGGVVLVVEVEERGTIVINELFPSTSAATAFWGGADCRRPISSGAGSTWAAGSSHRRRRWCRGPRAAWVCGCARRSHPSAVPTASACRPPGLYNDGSEFFRVAGADDDSNPADFVASRVKRAGGVLGIGKDFGRRLHAGLDFRQEALTAELPSPAAAARRRLHDRAGRQPAGDRHRQRRPRYALRSDPSPFRHARRAVGGGGEGLLGSSYQFVKTVARRRSTGRCRAGTRWGFTCSAADRRRSPYFDRFFIGDLNLLLPRRALGINFSTLSSPNLLAPASPTTATINTRAACWSNTRSRSGGGRGSSTAATSSPPSACSAWPATGTSAPPGTTGFHSLPIDLTGDIGLRLDTYVGIFTISITNAISRTSF